MKILAYKVVQSGGVGLKGGVRGNRSGSPMVESTLSRCDTDDINSLLRWLIFSHSSCFASVLAVTWSLSEFFNIIEAKLPPFVCESLSRHPHRAKLNNCKLFYIPDKVFSVNLNGSEISMYDLSQYFPGESEPSTLDELQARADVLQEVVTELGVADPATLSSPVALFKGHPLLAESSGIPTVFDASEPDLGAYEVAMRCTPREWVSNYQIGCWIDED